LRSWVMSEMMCAKKCVTRVMQKMVHEKGDMTEGAFFKQTCEQSKTFKKATHQFRFLMLLYPSAGSFSIKNSYAIA
jgi:hypothetical protein